MLLIQPAEAALRGKVMTVVMAGLHPHTVLLLAAAEQVLLVVIGWMARAEMAKLIVMDGWLITISAQLQMVTLLAAAVAVALLGVTEEVAAVVLAALARMMLASVDQLTLAVAEAEEARLMAPAALLMADQAVPAKLFYVGNFKTNYGSFCRNKFGRRCPAGVNREQR